METHMIFETHAHYDDEAFEQSSVPSAKGSCDRRDWIGLLLA